MNSLTIFTAPKPFTVPHISTIQRNAIRSWQQLGENVCIILLGDDSGIQAAAEELGVLHIPDVKCNEKGTPIVSSMLDLVRARCPSSIYMIINTDIILRPETIKSIQAVNRSAEKYLLVGQRWDLAVDNELAFTPGWEKDLQKELETHGKLHPRGGSDYFIFPDVCYLSIPDFAIGRAGWDNWMIFEARRRNWKVVDDTRDIQVIHQNHDYRHLPDGKPHYRLPETFENVRLAGGSLTIFTLEDCNYWLKAGKVQKVAWTWKQFWREVEIFPLVGLKSFTLARIFFAIFHPLKAYREIRAWMKKKITK